MQCAVAAATRIGKQEEQRNESERGNGGSPLWHIGVDGGTQGRMAALKVAVQRLATPFRFAAGYLKVELAEKVLRLCP